MAASRSGLRKGARVATEAMVAMEAMAELGLAYQ
jgi:hypothetical protein